MTISEQFSDFIDSEENGLDDIVSELNSKVALGNIDTEVTLDKCGKQYFLECMKLAKNVIISFEKSGG